MSREQIELATKTLLRLPRKLLKHLWYAYFFMISFLQKEIFKLIIIYISLSFSPQRKIRKQLFYLKSEYLILIRFLESFLAFSSLEIFFYKEKKSPNIYTHSFIENIFTGHLIYRL